MQQVIIVLIVVIILGGFLWFVLTSQGPQTAPVTSTGTVQDSGTSTMSTSTQATSTVRVSIRNFAYNPQSLNIATGTTVVWVNEDSVAHDVLFSNGVKSPLLAQGESYSRTFNTAGTFSYICSIHPSMTGSVIVK